MNQAAYEIAEVHWRMHRKSVFPATLRGRSVELHEQNAHPLRRRTLRKNRQPSDITPQVYDCSDVSKQVTVYLSNVFDHGQEADPNHEMCGLQSVLEEIVSTLDGDEWQYFWRLTEIVKLFCIPEER